MSRRKQSHPKSIKRKSEDELSSLALSYNLPTDLLELQEVSDGVDQLRIHAATVLGVDATFGPYSVHKLDLADGIKREAGQLTIKFPDDNGVQMVNLDSDQEVGRWLTLLKRAEPGNDKEPHPANIAVILQDDSITCEVTQEITKGEELIAEFVTRGRSYPQLDDVITVVKTEPVDEASPLHSAPLSPVSPVSPSSPASPPELTSIKVEHATDYPSDDAALSADSRIYPCVFCSVKFSSISTLEAHVAYYCSKKSNAASLGITTSTECTPEVDRDTGSPDGMSPQRDYSSPDATPIYPEHRSKKRKHEEPDGLSPSAKMSRTEASYNCTQCSYSTDKRTALMQHQRHAHSKLSDDEVISPPPQTDEDLPPSSMFCHHCNIQFSSLKTYTGHKEFYCSAREHQGAPAYRSGGGASVEESGEMMTTPLGVTNGYLHESPASAAAKAVLTAAAMQNLLHNALQSGFDPTQLANMTQAAAANLASQAALLTSPGVDRKPEVPTMILPQVVPPIPLHTEPSSAGSSPARSPLKSPVRAHQSPKSQLHSTPPQHTGEQPLDLSKKTSSTPEPGCDDVKIPSRSHTSPPQHLASHGSRVRPQAPYTTSSRRPGKQQGNTASTAAGYPGAGMVMPTASISKCVDCNIVFYKHENYLIHKRHYCSGRQSDVSPPAQPAPVVPPVSYGSIPISKSSPRSCHSSSSAGSSPGRHNTPAPAPVIDPMYINHYCVPCKIKFSSIDTLLCHQQYYCPSRQSSPPDTGHVTHPPSSPSLSPRAPADPRSRVGGAGDVDTHQCIHCGHVFANVRMLKLHQCTAAQQQSEEAAGNPPVGQIHVPMLRCPYCEYVTQSDTRLVEHIKAHAPTRAYKCSICGYRGNTVRGMRMHGKVHADSGEHFSDDNMLVIEQPALIPKRFRTTFSDSAGANGGGVADGESTSLEAELIRLKNEPYKRRKSRKGYEKSENMVPRMHLLSCHLCSHVCNDTGSLSAHVRQCHEQLQAYHCRMCDFVGHNKMTLVRHVKSKHELSRDMEREMERDTDSHVERARESPTEVKPESWTPDHAPPIEMKNGHQSPSSIRSGMEEDIDVVKTEVHPIDEVAQMKSEPVSPGSSPVASLARTSPKLAPTLSNGHRIYAAQMKRSPIPSPPPLIPVKLESSSSPTPPDFISDEPSTLNIQGRDSTGNNNNSMSVSKQNGELPVLTEQQNQGVRLSCAQCGITFKYTSTYVAHTKYYCNMKNTNETPSGMNTPSGPPALSAPAVV